jgi:hypothetical protein
MKSLMILVATLCVGALAGCAGSGQPVTPAQLKAALNDVPTVVAAGCQLVQPGLQTAATLTPGTPEVGVAAGANGVFCALNENAASAAQAASAPAASQ